nr:MAG TPA: hypothetical protein [Caudoviricetes sp.]
MGLTAGELLAVSPAFHFCGVSARARRKFAFRRLWSSIFAASRKW